MDKKTQIIAVAGKGGVGKTSLAGVIVKLLVEAHPDKKILAIDADPAVGLSTVLNVEVDKTIRPGAGFQHCAHRMCEPWRLGQPQRLH